LTVDFANPADDQYFSESSFTFDTNRSSSAYGAAGRSPYRHAGEIGALTGGALNGGILREFGNGGWGFYVCRPNSDRICCQIGAICFLAC